jgi:prolyl-tRNA synthetase
LGCRVVFKIEEIIREELNLTGAQEMLMPLLHPREIWDQTGRWSDPAVKEIMYQFKDIRGKEFGLSFTHEEIMMNLLGKYIKSYKDLPIKLYHFSTKFRNEPRAKSGILRGREFLMKDLYSAHTSKEDLYKYYEEVKAAYLKIFERIGLEIIVAEASGGVFTSDHSHEFQTPSEIGEDTIFYCKECGFAENKEIYKSAKKCHKCGGEIEETNSIEVGNIFPLGIKYAEKMGVNFTDEKGEQKPLWFASYGIGVSRLLGAIVEVFHDEKGIIWPENVAPFKIHLVGLDLEDVKVVKEAEKTCKLLEAEGIEVLYDDRVNVSAGEKFADADLIGIPFRVVISKKTEEKLEVKKRNSKETEFITLKELISKVSDS